MEFKKVHAVRGKNLGDYISVDIAVFINCPSREGYHYVVRFLDHATKLSWVYPLTGCHEFIKNKLRFLRRQVEMTQREDPDVTMPNGGADGGAELISKKVLAILKR